MKLCERCSVLGCCLDYLGESCERARMSECPDVVPTNFEKLANFTCDELSNVIYRMINIFPILPNLDDISSWLQDTEDCYNILGGNK